jgi:hypothetical protein
MKKHHERGTGGKNGTRFVQKGKETEKCTKKMRKQAEQIEQKSPIHTKSSLKCAIPIFQ